MRLRLIAIALLIVTVLQGAVFAYAAMHASSDGRCERVMSDGSTCKACCAHGSSSCALQCADLLVTAMPAIRPSLYLRMPVYRVMIPESGVAPFAAYTPPHPFRPPIV